MDLAGTSFSTIKIDSAEYRIKDILSRLQQAGQFRAVVIQTSGNKVLLDTAFGQLSGVAPQKLAKGDEIMARLVPGKSDLTIKIDQVIMDRQALPQKILNQLIKISGNTSPAGTAESRYSRAPTDALTKTAFVAQAVRVVSHSQDKTLIQLNHKTFTIPRQNLLEAGETLLLKLSSNNKVELQRIQPEVILKNALSRLLPQIAAPQDASGLVKLQKLATELLSLQTAKTDSAPMSNALKSAAGTGMDKSILPVAKQASEAPIKTESPQQASSKDVSMQASTSSSSKEVPVKIMQQLLTGLSQPVGSAKALTTESLQQILRLFTLLKPATSQGQQNPASSIVQQLGELHRSISDSPDNFKLLIRQIIESNASGQKVNMSANEFLDYSNAIKTEVLQQLEQTLSQLAMQKTTLRLQQEQNLALQFNLNIPLQLDQQTTALKLKFKQRENNESPDDKHWEINLSFEFGILGLISTNILLQDSRLSAHFWAVKPATKLLIETHMDQFKNQLKKSGFELGIFDCFPGQPSQQDEAAQPIAENLVDINV